MNYRLVSKVLGALLLLIAFAMAVCTAYAWFQRDWSGGRGAFRALATSLGITFGTALILLLMGRKSGSEILRKEAIVIVGGGWFLCALFGAIPYLLCAPTNLSVVDAFFESMSGFTTTGSTVITDLDPFPKSIMLWRSLTQWLGGLGILVLFVALLAYLGVSSKMLMRHESSLELGEGKSSRIRNLAMRLWALYIGLTIACIGCLYVYGQIVDGVEMSWFDAILHAFTAVATGGFSPYNASIGYFDSIGVEVILMGFMVIASLNFLILLLLFRPADEKARNRIKTHEESHYFLGFLVIATALVTLDLMVKGSAESFGEALRNAVFPVVSVLTTAGFGHREDWDTWPLSSQFLLLGLFVVGGCAGSTSGGVKVGRVILFFRIAYHEIVRSFRPKQVFPLELNGRRADEAKLDTAFYLALITLIFVVSIVVVAILEPGVHDFKTAIGMVMSTLFNIGPGIGNVGPTDNFAWLGGPTKVFLSFLMLLGRLELFAILVLLAPSLWKKY